MKNGQPFSIFHLRQQRLSCNAGQAKFLAARAEILAGGGANRQQVGLSTPCLPLTLTTGRS